MPSMIYRATDRQFNADRQKWQVRCSVFNPNIADPTNPQPVPDYQGILIDCAGSGATHVKQACTAFCAAVESANDAALTALLDKLVNADTGEVIPTPV
mgnify:CR=1 FL=1